MRYTKKYHDPTIECKKKQKTRNLGIYSLYVMSLQNIDNHVFSCIQQLFFLFIFFLGVRLTWSRLVMDITHYRGSHFLTLIDCGLSQFAIWRPLCQQDSTSVIHQLESIFYEQSSPDEILTDNDTAFTCKSFKKFLNSCNRGYT